MPVRPRRPGSRWEQRVAPLCVCSRSTVPWLLLLLRRSSGPLLARPCAGPLPGLLSLSRVAFQPRLWHQCGSRWGQVTVSLPSRLSLSRVSREARCSRRIIGLLMPGGITVSPGAKNTPLVCALSYVWGGKPVEGWQRFTTGLLMTEKHIRAISAQPGENNKPQSATVMFTASSKNPGAVPCLRFTASFKLQFEDI